MYRVLYTIGGGTSFSFYNKFIQVQRYHCICTRYVRVISQSHGHILTHTLIIHLHQKKKTSCTSLPHAIPIRVSWFKNTDGSILLRDWGKLHNTATPPAIPDHVAKPMVSLIATVHGVKLRTTARPRGTCTLNNDELFGNNNFEQGLYFFDINPIERNVSNDHARSLYVHLQDKEKKHRLVTNATPTVVRAGRFIAW